MIIKARETKQMYSKPNQAIIDKYMNIYNRASLRDCLVGENADCRIYNRDSYMSTITDPEVFLEYVIYPQYIQGNKEIETAIIKEVEQLIASNNPIEFFQSINYLCCEKMLIKIYKEIPFCIYNDDRIKWIDSRLPEMKEQMIFCRYGDFGKYKETMFDMASRIMDNVTNRK